MALLSTTLPPIFWAWQVSANPAVLVIVFSEDTPFHNASIGYREPFRKPPPKEMLHELYEEDLSARRELRGRLEDKVLNGRGAPDSYEWLGQLLWHHLYPLPPDSILVEEQHGSHAKLPC